MDFYADVVALAVARGGKAQRLAVAEADLQHAFGIAAEHRVEIARLAGEIQPEARPQIVERALLGRREPALPQHEAAHPAPAFLDGERFRRGLAAFAGERIGHRAPARVAGAATAAIVRVVIQSAGRALARHCPWDRKRTRL